MTCHVTVDPSVADLALGLVEATEVTIAPAEPALTEYCRSWVTRIGQSQPEGGDDRRQAVRRLLRAGGFKPSGRNKPAQEYLLRTATDGSGWPVILNAVDVLNVVSLRSGLPISLIALDRAGQRLLVRYGRAGEQFVFNQAGQELDVTGLVSICRYEGERTIPIGTPVKDSQFAKVVPGDRHILACIFAPRPAVPVETLTSWSRELADQLRHWCHAPQVDVRIQ